MKKRILSLALALCMALCLLPMQSFADGVIQLDVGMENGETEDYKVSDTSIILRKEGTVYELTGSTDKKIMVWGSNAPDPAKTFRLRLNDAAINGGITITNSDGAKLEIEVVSGTMNTLSSVYTVDLTIFGSGTLNSDSLGVTQSKSVPNALHITDTTVNVSVSGNSDQWNGACVLDGSANVTYISSSDYTPLQIGVGGSSAHSLTLKDNAQLHCLQADASNASQDAVDGLDMFGGAGLTLQDNAYLEVEGRDTTGSYKSIGLIADGDIRVQGNATLKARAEGMGVYAPGSLTVDGGTIDAVSQTACAVYAKSSMTLNNALVKGIGGDGYYGIYTDGSLSTSNSWIETSLMKEDGVANSVLFIGTNGKVYGSASIPADVTISADKTLEIPEGSSLIVPANRTLVNSGTVEVKGSVVNNGTIICNNHNGGEASCKGPAECSLCGTPYGDPAPDKHGTLVKVDAKPATAQEEGNIEYYRCEDCGKLFRDPNGSEEISLADTVIPKLEERVPVRDDGYVPNGTPFPSAGGKTNNGDHNPNTGAAPSVRTIALLAGIGLLAALSVCGRRKGGDR